jgi:hypothetical protein
VKLDSKNFYIDEKQSNPMLVAICYPGCPINEVCTHAAVGFGTVLKQCEHLREKSSGDAECMYQEEIEG